MTTEEFLERALGGNMNISTLKLKFWYEIMEEYANQYKADQPQSREELRSELVKFTFYMKDQYKFIKSIDEDDIDEYLFRNPSK